MSVSPEPHTAVTLTELQHFLYHEARLLDSGRLKEWLDLFTADATYWIPLEAGQRDPYETSSIVFDDRRLLEARVGQYAHPRAHARMPLMRTVHQVGNVELLAQQADGSLGGEFTVASTLLVVEFRAERQRLYGALCEHRLRRVDGRLQIAAKRVDLVNSEAELDGIALLL